MILDPWQSEILNTKGNVIVYSGRQTGKSTIASIKASRFVVENDHKVVLIISVTEKQAEEMLQKILFYLQDNHRGLIKMGKDKPTKHTIRLKNGSMVRCEPVGQTGAGIRGFTIDMLIADEAAFMPEEIWAAVTPMLLTTGGEMMLISTPHGRKGYFYDCTQNKDFSVFHVNSEEVANQRSEPQRSMMLEYLKKERERMTELQYAQEYLGKFIDELGQFFPDEVLKKVLVGKRRGIDPQNTYFLGVDVARMGGDETTFEIIDRTDKKHLIHVESIVTRRTYTTQTTNTIIELNRKYNFKKIYIDDGGLGVAVLDQLLIEESTRRKVVAINNASRPLDRDETKKKKILKEDLYNNLLRLMERGEITLLDDAEIYLSLKSVQYEYSDKGDLRIFGNYTHITEGLIRAAYSALDKSLNLWVY